MAMAVRLFVLEEKCDFKMMKKKYECIATSNHVIDKTVLMTMYLEKTVARVSGV